MVSAPYSRAHNGVIAFPRAGVGAHIGELFNRLRHIVAENNIFKKFAVVFVGNEQRALTFALVAAVGHANSGARLDSVISTVYFKVFIALSFPPALPGLYFVNYTLC